MIYIIKYLKMNNNNKIDLLDIIIKKWILLIKIMIYKIEL